MRKRTSLVMGLTIILGTTILSLVQWRYGVPFTFLQSGSLLVTAAAKYPVSWTDRQNFFVTRR